MASRVSRIKIIIETLTGTLFELLVPPQDTVLSIKWRIYRIEGNINIYSSGISIEKTLLKILGEQVKNLLE